MYILMQTKKKDIAFEQELDEYLIKEKNLLEIESQKIIGILKFNK